LGQTAGADPYLATRGIVKDSLIGQLPLAAVEISCKDIEGSRRFYKEVMGFREIDDGESAPGSKEDDSKNIHFDLGNIRLTLSQLGKPVDDPKGSASLPGRQFVFVVENAIDAVYADLSKRGVKFKSRKVYEDSSGKAVWFSDPDGNLIYLWQPPHRDSKNFKNVQSIVKHYELVSRALADLREDEAASA
jgi:catechol 2,3-dioxygenase-like lactoylglutathione lyase family enzyme